MGRPKLYANAAEKSRAYRSRRAAEMILVERVALTALETQVDGLAAAVHSAQRAGCPIAQQIVGVSTGTVIDELTAWFKASAKESRK